MAQIPVTLQFGGLGASYCFTTLNQFASDIIAATTATIQNGFSPIVISSTAPAVNQRSFGWIKLNNDGTPATPAGPYVFAEGKWVFPNPILPGAAERRIWVGTSAASIYSYDGGDGNDPVNNPSGQSDTTGAMWQIDPAFNFKIPMGCGDGTGGTTLGSAVNLGHLYNGALTPTTIVLNGTAGEEQHLLAPLELAQHAHFWGRQGWHVSGTDDSNSLSAVGAKPEDGSTNSNPTVPNAFLIGAQSDGSPGGGKITLFDLATALNNYLVAGNYQATTGADGASGNAPNSHQNLQPLLVVAYIMRTSRRMYVGG